MQIAPLQALLTVADVGQTTARAALAERAPRLAQLARDRTVICMSAPGRQLAADLPPTLLLFFHAALCMDAFLVWLAGCFFAYTWFYFLCRSREFWSLRWVRILTSIFSR